MKRVLACGLFIAAFFLFTHARASAMAEFCPAGLKYQAVGQSPDSKAPAALYGFELTALGPRTVTTATLAFDTSAGWFTAVVPSVALREKKLHFSGYSGNFTAPVYVSPILYVRLPASVSVNHAWVYSATAKDDSLGWQQEGSVECPPAAPPPERPHVPGDNIPGWTLDPKDRDRLSALPQATSIVIGATQSEPLERPACSEPFIGGTVTKMQQVGIPSEVQPFMSGETTAVVDVAIDKTGTVTDAWTWASTGYRRLDEAAVWAAKNSTYSAAESYCQAVPSLYTFVVDFDPN